MQKNLPKMYVSAAKKYKKAAKTKSTSVKDVLVKSVLSSEKSMKDTVYLCVICKNQFINLHHLSHNMHWHTGINSINCSICNETFSMMDTLEKQLVVHCIISPISLWALPPNVYLKPGPPEAHKGAS